MRSVSVILTGIIAMLGVTLAPHPVMGCGYENPKDVQRGAMNFIYPDSLHVFGAIWRMQQAGRLPMPDMTRKMATGDERRALDREAYFKVLRALQSLGASFDMAASRQHSIAIVLLEPMMWNRFPVGEERAALNFELDVRGAEGDDLVVVTDEPVLLAVAEGRLSIAEALDAEAIKLYGGEEKVAAFTSHFKEIGNGAMPKANLTVLYEKFFARRKGSLRSSNLTEPTIETQ